MPLAGRIVSKPAPTDQLLASGGIYHDQTHNSVNVLGFLELWHALCVCKVETDCCKS